MAIVNSINNKTSELTVDPGASGDSFVQFNIGTGKFRIGVDDTDDSFRISQGSALGTNDTFIMSSAGERTMPLQSAFLVILTSTKSNVTGNNVKYTASWDSEIFDQNSDFSGTTFTAPVTGRYRFEASMLLGDLTSTHNNNSFRLETSNRTYLIQNNPGGSRSSADEYSCYMSVLADMDASDTAVLAIQVVGSTQTVDVESNGSSDPQTWWSGNLEV